MRRCRTCTYIRQSAGTSEEVDRTINRGNKNRTNGINLKRDIEDGVGRSEAVDVVDRCGEVDGVGEDFHFRLKKMCVLDDKICCVDWHEEVEGIVARSNDSAEKEQVEAGVQGEDDGEVIDQEVGEFEMLNCVDHSRKVNERNEGVVGGVTVGAENCTWCILFDAKVLVSKRDVRKENLSLNFGEAIAEHDSVEENVVIC